MGLQDDKVYLKVQIGRITNSNQTNLDKIGNLKKEAVNNGKMEKQKSDTVVMLHKFAVGAFKITTAEKLGVKAVKIRRLNLSLDSYRARNRQLAKETGELKSRLSNIDSLTANRKKTDIQVNSLQCKATVR